MTRSIIPVAFAFAQIIVGATYADTVPEKLNIKSHFTLKISDPIPTEYVFTKGSNKPKFDPWGVPLFTVSDLDNDGCDDVVLDWTDSLTPIQVFYGNSDGAVKRADVFEQKYNVRTVRQFEFADLNEDGVQDIVGFTSPHGWKESELGIAWDADEPEFIALSRGKRSYKVLNSSYETYSHTGLLGDVDNDGITEIIQITEDPAKGTEIKIIDELKFITTGKTSINRSNHVIFDAEVGDLNNDGLLDTVITLSKSHMNIFYKNVRRSSTRQGLLD